MKKVKKWKRAAALALAGLLVTPVSASAKSELMDELNEIIENQTANAPKSLLERTIGMKEMSEKMKESGLSFQLGLSLPEETIQLLDLSDSLQEGNYINFGLKLDPVQKKWLLDAGAGQASGSPLLDMSIYGDSEQLEIAVPQFLDNALAIRSGSLMEQYHGSALEQMMGELPLESDINLNFFPDLAGMMASVNPAAALESILGESVEELENRITVEKKEEDGQTVYVVTAPFDAALDVYRDMISAYCKVIMQTGAVSVSDIMEMEDEIDTMLDTLELAMDDELLMYYYVENNLLTRLTFGMTMDMNKVMELDETVNGEADGTDATSAASEDNTVVIGGADGPTSIFLAGKLGEDGSAENIVRMDYDVIYSNPADPSEGVDVAMVMKDLAETQEVSMNMAMRRESTETTETMGMTLRMTADGETVYDGEVFRSSFDAQTGDYDATFQIEEDGTEVAFILDSTFRNVETGKGFELAVDQLGIRAADESVGLTGSVAMSADPGEIEALPDAKMVLELTQEELTNLLMEFQMKAGAWSAQFEPEDYDAYDEEYYMEDSDAGVPAYEEETDLLIVPEA